MCGASESGCWWIVFFAPSAAEFVTPLLRQSFDLPTLELPDSVPTNKVNLAAIGPTTYAFLGDNLKLRIAVCSPRPTPEALAAAIQTFETRPIVD
jgi:uroporphyrinogen-III synthase